MRKITYLFLALMLCISTTVTLATNFTTGNLVVLRVGDGSAALSNASTAIFLEEYTTAGVLVQTIAIPTSGTNMLTASGSATSEGQMTLSTDGYHLTLSGYDKEPGTASIAGTTSATVNRKIISVNYTGNIDNVLVSATAFSGNNFRGAVKKGNDFWGSGNGSAGNNGIQYFGTGTPVQVTSTVTNIRSINIFNDQLYFSTGSGTIGIYKVGTGTPTTTGNTSTLEIAVGGTSPSPYAFAFNSNNTICYVADDRTNVNGGVKKYIKSEDVWTEAYTINLATPPATNIGARGLTVDWSGTSPVVFATGTDSKLYKVIDENAGSTAVELATAPTNTAFRSLAFAPRSSVPTSAASASIDTWTLKNKTLYFDAMPSTNIEVYSVTGSKVASFEPAMQVALNLSKGIYIVKVNKAVSKIILK